jgi:hypothetical protein
MIYDIKIYNASSFSFKLESQEKFETGLVKNWFWIVFKNQT